MSHYEMLKEEIIKKTSNSLDLDKVKNYYSVVINSRRKLSRVKNLKAIFHLLEEQDALDSNNISSLKILGKLLQNEDITKLVHSYEKVYTEQETCICGRSTGHFLPIINPERQSLEKNENNELQTAVQNVAMNIGKHWRVLASELCIPECHVDEVREKYPNDYQIQALKILQVWIKCDGEAATVEILKKTLESRLCKKKGIGLHMLKLIKVE